MEHGKPLSASENSRNFDGVCQNIRAAVDSVRVHAVSLHDEKGEVLWMTESSMGPDEHNAVKEAYELFSSPQGRPAMAYDLGDFRSAVLFRAVNARRSMVGAAMLVLDTRGLQQDNRGLARLMTPKLQSALSEFAGMRPAEAGRVLAKPPASPAGAAASKPSPSEAGLTPPPQAKPMESALVKPALVKPALVKPTLVKPTLVKPAPVPAAPAARPRQPPVSPQVDRLNAALRSSPILLSVQRLMPLAKGSELLRYEVLLRSNADDGRNAAPEAMLKVAVDHGLGSMIDRRVLTELIGWLVRHPEVWKRQPSMFSVNLTSTALQDEHFVKFVGLCLAKSALPAAMIGFEIDVATAIRLADQVAAVADGLHRLGCPLVLDDFGMRTECFDLLRLPGVRYVKLSSAITQKMRADRLSQAAITAVVQMARVLGMHTVAKRTESAAEHEWLTALGVDFVQSNALSPATGIDSLLKSART